MLLIFDSKWAIVSTVRHFKYNYLEYIPNGWYELSSLWITAYGMKRMKAFCLGYLFYLLSIKNVKTLIH